MMIFQSMPQRYHVSDKLINSQRDNYFNHTCDMKDEELLDLKSRLKSARTAAGLSQTQLAKNSKVSQATIAMLETGARVTARYITQIASALGVLPLWLAEGKGPRTAEYPKKTDDVNEQKPAPYIEQLTLKEQNLINLWRAANNPGKASIERIAALEAGAKSPTQKPIGDITPKNNDKIDHTNLNAGHTKRREQKRRTTDHIKTS